MRTDRTFERDENSSLADNFFPKIEVRTDRTFERDENARVLPGEHRHLLGCELTGLLNGMKTFTLLLGGWFFAVRTDRTFERDENAWMRVTFIPLSLVRTDRTFERDENAL